MSEKRKYDSTVARIAGNIAAGLVTIQYYQDSRYYQYSDRPILNRSELATTAVDLARRIIAEVQATEPKAEDR